jgi:hypothetical protein
MTRTKGTTPRKTVIMAKSGVWFAAWELDTPYIDVFGNSSSYSRVKRAFERGEDDPESVAVHAINTSGDNWGKTPEKHAAYVKAELLAWIEEQGDDYRENGHY